MPAHTMPSSPTGRKVAPGMARVGRSPRSPGVAATRRKRSRLRLCVDRSPGPGRPAGQRSPGDHSCANARWVPRACRRRAPAWSAPRMARVASAHRSLWVAPNRTSRRSHLGPAPAGKGGLGRPPPCPAAGCTQDGQGGLGPQESQGRTERQELPGPMRFGPAMHPPGARGRGGNQSSLREGLSWTREGRTSNNSHGKI